MSDRRMFSRSITESDAFLDLSFAAQSLYFHMALNADDEGFLNCSRKICVMCGATESELNELLEAGFLIRFDSGIFVIKHWKINNKIRSDRCKSTNYPEEKALLSEKTTGVYSLIKNREESSEQISIPEKIEAADEHKEQFENEKTSESSKNLAEQVFDILFASGLPCNNGNLISFVSGDFRQAVAVIRRLRLSDAAVVEAVKNYASVIELSRQGGTWWNCVQDFPKFCKGGTILRFLPENFKIVDYLKQDRGKSNTTLEGKIQL